MTAPDDVVFLLDCDNTLLDNDLVQDDLRQHLAREFGPASAAKRATLASQARAGAGTP